MRKYLFPFLAVVLALALFVPQAYAQDDFSLVCSSPIADRTLGVVPTSVTLWFSAEVTEAIVDVANADGESVVAGEATVAGPRVIVELGEVAPDATYTVSGTVNGTEVDLSFTVGRNALVVENPALANDCPADFVTTVEETPTEEPTAEETPTEEPTAEETPTEEPTAEETPTEEPTAEETEAPLLEGTVSDASGTTSFSVGIPTGYASNDVEGFFLFPVVVMASSEETIESYVADPDSVQEYVVIYTKFTSEDLGAFGLDNSADAQTIVSTLMREDSTAEPAEEVTIAGAPALKVTFTNAVSGKSGVFYLVSFVGEAGTNYLLIQGSAPTADWANYEASFQAVVDSIALAE